MEDLLAIIITSIIAMIIFIATVCYFMFFDYKFTVYLKSISGKSQLENSSETIYKEPEIQLRIRHPDFIMISYLCTHDPQSKNNKYE